MISKRRRRPSDPQERLRQFSLNNSKGVDESKPITDNNTVQAMENLKVNPDGSLSLRNPLSTCVKIQCGRDLSRIFPVFEDKYLIFFTDGCFGIYDTEEELPITVQWYDYTGSLKTIQIPVSSTSTYFDTAEASVVTGATKVTVGGCYVYNNALGASLVNAEIYDSTDKLPRYLQLSCTDSSVLLEIKTPEPNVLRSDGNELSVDYNTTLDNPFSISDEYGKSFTDLKGILPYVYTDAELIPTEYSGTPTVLELTESVKESRFRIASSIGPGEIEATAYLKAFGSFPKLFEKDVSTELHWSTVSADALDIYDFENGSCGITAKSFGTHVVRCTVTTSQGGSSYATCNLHVDYPIKTINITNVTIDNRELGSAIPSETDTVNIAVRFKLVSFDNTFVHVSDFSRFRVTRMPQNLEITEQAYSYRSSSYEYVLNLTCRYVGTLSKFNGRFAIVYYPMRWGEPSVTAVADSIVIYNDSDFNESTRIVDTPDPEKYDSVGESSDSVVLNINRAYMYINDYVRLTATVNTSNADSGVYAAWFKANYDGTYTPIPLPETFEKQDVYEPLATFIPGQDSDETFAVEYASVKNYTNSNEPVSSRIDVLQVDEEALRTPHKLRFITLRQDSEHNTVPNLVLGEAVYTPNLSSSWEFAQYEDGNSSKGKKLLYKSSIYSYGDTSFNNTVYKSDAGSLITPYLNSITADSTGLSKVVAVVPWRDYLYIATESTSLLATPVENGFYTKIVNTFIGIPEEDAECCKSTLNGIVFKSGSKVFLGYPNLYSESDAVLNYTEISKPIETVLEDEEYNNCYALTTSSEYMLFLVKDTETCTLVYDFNNKSWTVNRYLVALKDAYNHKDGTVHAFYSDSSSVLEVTLSGNPSGERYADELDGSIVPINFKWDTGQKTDSISDTKQFVESKLMFATLSDMDAFPFTAYVAIDGDPHVTKVDVSTDAPFWKTSTDDRGVLGTAFELGVSSPVSDKFNTLRQFVIRYSGKGKSIRHLILGESLYNFKLYETYVRYKNLNVK